MCDSDPASIEFFSKHRELMRNLGQRTEYKEIKTIDEFFKVE